MILENKPSKSLLRQLRNFSIISGNWIFWYQDIFILNMHYVLKKNIKIFDIS